ncbi:hypothetical protein [Flavobacterium microcysteis]
MRATFEEKTYENYFNAELDRKTNIFFPIGQVQEGSLGFDALAFSRSRSLWRMLGHPFWFFPYFTGIELREIADEMEHFLGIQLRELPRIKANIIFQYKKPEKITIASGKEWSNWNQPYFRYDIYKEQQKLLMHIHNTFGNQTLVVYASPAIIDVNELVSAHKQGKLIEKSNFKKAFEINQHHRNTYIQEGTYSIACSEPERIDNFDLIEEINNLGDKNFENNGISNENYIIDFRKKIEDIVIQNHFYSESFTELNKSLEAYYDYKVFYSLLVMRNFRLLTGNQWLVKI